MEAPAEFQPILSLSMVAMLLLTHTRTHPTNTSNIIEMSYMSEYVYADHDFWIVYTMSTLLTWKTAIALGYPTFQT